MANVSIDAGDVGSRRTPARSIIQSIAVGTQRCRIETDKNYQLWPLLVREVFRNGSYRNARGRFARKTVDTRRNRGKCDIAKPLCAGDADFSKIWCSPAAPPCHTGPTVWMTCEAGNLHPPDSRASPAGHPPSFRHSA